MLPQHHQNPPSLYFTYTACFSLLGSSCRYQCVNNCISDEDRRGANESDRPQCELFPVCKRWGCFCFLANNAIENRHLTKLVPLRMVIRMECRIIVAACVEWIYSHSNFALLVMCYVVVWSMKRGPFSACSFWQYCIAANDTKDLVDATLIESWDES